jgi:hypothetical protein
MSTQKATKKTPFADKTVLVNFRVSEKIVNKVRNKHKGFEGTKVVTARLREFYATLVKK